MSAETESRPTSVSSAGVPHAAPAGTTHARLQAWVDEVAALTEPDAIHWCDGSEAEWTSLTDRLVDAGTFTRLTAKPNSFHCTSDPSDVARVEDQTYICSVVEADAGATNNWMAPAEMKSLMTELYRGACTVARCTSSRS
jgi:phosphoenolpyruvate carboxykinase (GTP)